MNNANDTFQQALRLGYDPKSAGKYRERRTMYVTCRMTEEMHTRFKEYCKEHNLSLSDALNDFVESLMTQDYGKKVASFLAEHHLNSIMGSKETLKRTRSRIGQRIKEEVLITGPVHCGWKECSYTFDPKDFDPEHPDYGEKLKKYHFIDGKVFHHWYCAYNYLKEKKDRIKKDDDV